MRMTFIAFFAGIGGFHSGFEKAGCNSVDETKIDESWTKEDIEEAASDIFFNQCNYSYEVVDE